MNLDDALQTFIAESGELLESMEGALLAASGAPADDEGVNAIFRAAHTIKGSAGLFGIDHLVAFTHVAESVLDRVRGNALALDAGLIALLLACCDHLNDLVAEVAGAGTAENLALTAAGAPLVARLTAYLEADPARAPTPEAPARRVEFVDPDGVASEHWHISIQFGPEVLRNGMDPLSFLRYLGTMGEIVRVVTTSQVPPLATLDPERCHLGFEVAYRSDAPKAQIEAAFDFVRDDCQLRILAPHSRVEQYLQLLADSGDAGEMLGAALVRTGTLTDAELAAALAVQAGSKPFTPIGSILVEQGVVAPRVVQAALERQSRAREVRQEQASVRVDAAKLDQLINLVGELIIASAGASTVARRTQNAQFLDCCTNLGALVEEVRNSALQLRMVKIGATFNRFQRVVHDVALELGKQITLEISGEDTELDKTVVEKIADPLTHLVRNAMDHGIEAAELRAARGKPAAGTIHLHAWHDSGSIVIEVSDDGGGLQRERIIAKAQERGLIEEGRNLTDEEAFDLIFEPGFSTADQVTNLSGRGVGMDVVKKNITALRGTVHLASTAGAGTTVSVRLPLTLAIINGFQVSVGRAVFVIPLEMVEECVEYRAAPGQHYADLRGQVLPFVHLGELFGVDGGRSARRSIVVVRYAGGRAGLVVDGLLGESQTVIKPLGRMFQHLQCISGSSILGTGEVALILDVPALIRQAHHQHDERVHREVAMSP